MTTSTSSTATKQSSRLANTRPAEASGTFLIGDIPVHRLGFGAMQLTGDGVWGEPADHSEAIAVLRRSVELGINLIDTADSYGPGLTNGSRMAGPSTCGRRSRVASTGCIFRGSICYNCTGSTRK